MEKELINSLTPAERLESLLQILDTPILKRRLGDDLHYLVIKVKEDYRRVGGADLTHA